jgi:hypothetical protein
MWGTGLTPTARTESDRAAQVVINASGQAIIATVAAGTMTPPRPKAAKLANVTATAELPGFKQASEPPKQVSIPEASNRIHFEPPLQYERRAFQKIAPTAVAVATGKPRIPIWTGSGFQTREMVSGQKLRREKKFMPATKATAKAGATTRWPVKSSFGTMGWRANFTSQTMKAASMAMPMRRMERV